MRGKCIHPRRMVRFMREFLEAASDMTYITPCLPPAPAGVELSEWIGNPANWEEMQFSCEILLTKGDCNFGAYLYEYENDDSVLHISFSPDLYNRPYERDVFSRFAHKRASYAQGFSGVTLSLLHELGHFETKARFEKEYPSFNRREALSNARAVAKSTKELNEKYYFNFPDEKLATDWAIAWLANAEHRKIAKAFERKFFECFEKNA